MLVLRAISSSNHGWYFWYWSQEAGILALYREQLCVYLGTKCRKKDKAVLEGPALLGLIVFQNAGDQTLKLEAKCKFLMQGGGCSMSFLMSGMICTDLELKHVQFAGAANCVTISPSLIPLTSEKWAFKLGETQEKNAVDVSQYKQLCRTGEKQRDSRSVAMASYM